MKHHLKETFRRSLQFWLFCLVCLIFVVQSAWSAVLFLRLKEPLLIGIDANGTRLVTAHSDPIFKTEGLAFVQKFFTAVYNFNSANFLKQFGFATTLMSENLWKKKESEIIELQEKVKRESIEVQGAIEKITRDDYGNYHGLIRVSEKSRLKDETHLLKVEIHINKVPRNQTNPYGLEVDFYEETLLRD